MNAYNAVGTSLTYSYKPFLRWAGGKRWLAKIISPLVKKRLNGQYKYFEPFLGSGAMFFSLQPKRAILSDINKDLIVTFSVVSREPTRVIERLLEMPSTRDEYYRVRDWKPRSNFDKAVRFIYLNRNCYGGLYRENKLGAFNVPYGGGTRSHRYICESDILLRASAIINKRDVTLRVCHFGEAINLAGKGDVIYCDPTYRDVTRIKFDRYGKTIFSWQDQIRLAELLRGAFTRGALVILSNTSSNGVSDLYKNAGIVRVGRRKGLGHKKDKIKQSEFLMILDPMADWSYWERIGDVEIQGLT